MQPTNTTHSQPSAQPAPRTLTLTKDTLRRLTAVELRRTAGGKYTVRYCQN